MLRPRFLNVRSGIRTGMGCLCAAITLAGCQPETAAPAGSTGSGTTAPPAPPADDKGPVLEAPLQEPDVSESPGTESSGTDSPEKG